MKINHIAMYVLDLEGMKKFYETYFAGVSNVKYHNKKTDLMTYFISFHDEVRLELMTRPSCVDMEKNLYKTGYIHLAFSVGSKEDVRELTKRLQLDGHEVISEPRTTGDGYYESCVLDPEGNVIEIVE